MLLSTCTRKRVAGELMFDIAIISDQRRSRNEFSAWFRHTASSLKRMQDNVFSCIFVFFYTNSMGCDRNNWRSMSIYWSPYQKNCLLSPCLATAVNALQSQLSAMLAAAIGRRVNAPWSSSSMPNKLLHVPACEPVVLRLVVRSQNNTVYIICNGAFRRVRSMAPLVGGGGTDACGFTCLRCG